MCIHNCHGSHIHDLVHLVAILRAGGFTLLDTQFLTEHLTRFGAVEIDREAYRERLAKALSVQADFGAVSGGQEIADLV